MRVDNHFLYEGNDRPEGMPPASAPDARMTATISAISAVHFISQRTAREEAEKHRAAATNIIS